MPVQAPEARWLLFWWLITHRISTICRRMLNRVVAEPEVTDIVVVLGTEH
jgi:hypothetical protein